MPARTHHSSAIRLPSRSKGKSIRYLQDRVVAAIRLQNILVVIFFWVVALLVAVMFSKDAKNNIGQLLGISEPPRVSRRLQLLRGWSHDKTKQVFTGGKRARSADGFRPAGSARISVVSDLIDCVED